MITNFSLSFFVWEEVWVHCWLCGRSAGGIRRGQNSYSYGHSTHPSLHPWSLLSSGDFQRTFLFWTLPDSWLSFLILFCSFFLPTEIARLTVWFISTHPLLSSTLPIQRLPYSSLLFSTSSVLLPFPSSCRYLKSSFIIDLLSCFPWDLIFKVPFFIPFHESLFISLIFTVVKWIPRMSLAEWVVFLSSHLA